MNKQELTEITQKHYDAMNELFEPHRMMAAIDAGIAKANELGVGVTFCIMNADRVVQMSYHLPNANLVSVQLAPKKAWSAISMKQPTKEVSSEIQPGAPLYAMETMLDGDLVSFAGGIPLVLGEQIVGAVGVSGGLVEEDQAICEATVAKLMAF